MIVTINGKDTWRPNFVLTRKRRLMKECRRYMDSTAWIMNFHENRRAA